MLNRITEQISYTGASTTTYTVLAVSGDYTNTFTYDAAGNIATQVRNGPASVDQDLDDLTYHYYTSTGGTYVMDPDGSAPVNATNKLAYVDDVVASGNYGDDIDDQSSGNYEYDDIGNLTKDVSEEIDNIEWNVYGKIESITREATSTKPDLVFIYDAFGQRIVKIVKPRNGSGIEVQDEWSYTYYMRDASGNVMATYERSYTEVSADVVDKLQLKETHLYGASRIGIKDRDYEAIYSDVTRTYSTISVDKEYIITGTTGSTAMSGPDLSTPERYLGYKQLEFSNHLGNVLVTLSDRKMQVETGGGGSVDYFMSDVRSYSDYSAFGVALEGRHGGSYRYAFNGQEKEPEIIEGSYSAEFWQYDSRLGRRWNLDPKPNSAYTTYACFENSPISLNDPKGDTVRYGSFRDRLTTLVVRLFNEDFNKKFKEWDSEKEVTYIEFKRNTSNTLADAPRLDETYDMDPGNCQLMYHYVNYSKGILIDQISIEPLRMGLNMLKKGPWQIVKPFVGIGYGLFVGIHNLFTPKDRDLGWGWANRVYMPNGKVAIIAWGFGDYNHYNIFGMNISSSPWVNGAKKIHPRNGLFGYRNAKDPDLDPTFIDLFQEIDIKGVFYHIHYNFASEEYRDRFLRGEKIINFKY